MLQEEQKLKKSTVPYTDNIYNNYKDEHKRENVHVSQLIFKICTLVLFFDLQIA